MKGRQKRKNPCGTQRLTDTTTSPSPVSLTPRLFFVLCLLPFFTCLFHSFFLNPSPVAQFFSPPSATSPLSHPHFLCVASEDTIPKPAAFKAGVPQNLPRLSFFYLVSLRQGVPCQDQPSFGAINPHYNTEPADLK